MPDDIPALIAEARTWPREGVNEGPLINALADALESLTAERDRLRVEARRDAVRAIRDVGVLLQAEADLAAAQAIIAEARTVEPADWSTTRLQEVLRILSGSPQSALRTREAAAWDAGYEAAARFHEGREKGHWENDSPRKGMRTWRPDPVPENPHRTKEAD